MKKQHLILMAAAMILTAGCNRLDIAGMVVNRSDTEERVADWLDYNARYGEPIILNAPDEYHIYSCSDSHYSERDSILVRKTDFTNTSPPSAMTRWLSSPSMPATWSTKVARLALG